jgi:hypothetical protein
MTINQRIAPERRMQSRCRCNSRQSCGTRGKVWR